MNDPIWLVCFLYSIVTVLRIGIIGYLIYLFFEEGGDE